MKGLHLLAISLLTFALLAAVGCQSSRPTNRQLLERDYSQMTDQELLEYYRQLDDRISGRDADGGGGGGFGFGVGMGFGFDGGAVGLGASKGVAGDDPLEALQFKRNQVRLELARRGLEPLPAAEP
jgi:hypothetical protein